MLNGPTNLEYCQVPISKRLYDQESASIPYSVSVLLFGAELWLLGLFGQCQTISWSTHESGRHSHQPGSQHLNRRGLEARQRGKTLALATCFIRRYGKRFRLFSVVILIGSVSKHACGTWKRERRTGGLDELDAYESSKIDDVALHSFARSESCSTNRFLEMLCWVNFWSVGSTQYLLAMCELAKCHD